MRNRRNINRMRSAAIALLVGAGGGAVLSCVLVTAGVLSGTSAAAALGGKTAHVMACGQGASPIAFVARLSDRQGTNALQASGFRIAAHQAASGAAASMVLLSPRKADGTLTSVAALQSVVGVSSAAPVLPQSADPALRSCDYRLQDRPQAAPLVAAAETALAARGLATRQEMEGAGALFLISDNPLDGNQAIVTIDVPGNPVALSGGMHAYSEVPLEAFVDRSTHQVTQTATGLPH